MIIFADMSVVIVIVVVVVVVVDGDDDDKTNGQSASMSWGSTSLWGP
jgi:hypothetical protein